jgi:dTDP-4-amino-4,6-dideoxygalactose transaminase
MAVPGVATRVPFLDLTPTHAPLSDVLVDDFESLIASSAFTNGPQVREFEQAFAAYCRVTHCVGVASGLDALRLALVVRDIGEGDEVIVPAQTFVATLEAVSQVGAIPVPVDIRDDDYCLDPEATSAALTSRTRAVMPVHLYGQMADVAALSRLCERAGIDLIEDACQAHGACRDGIRAGRAGIAAAFSFYPGKNLGAMGDAGALVTDVPTVAENVRALREHGQRRKYEHDEIGWTARLDTVQAMVLLRKLPFLDEWNEQRRRAAAFYGEALAGVGDLALPTEVPGADHTWHLYVVRTADPFGLAAFLAGQAVGTGRHYPQPPHLTDAYSHLGLRAGQFPTAERLAAECLSLPMFPGITESQLEHVVASVRAWFARG